MLATASSIHNPPLQLLFHVEHVKGLLRRGKPTTAGQLLPGK